MAQNNAATEVNAGYMGVLAELDRLPMPGETVVEGPQPRGLVRWPDGREVRIRWVDGAISLLDLVADATEISARETAILRLQSPAPSPVYSPADGPAASVRLATMALRDGAESLVVAPNPREIGHHDLDLADDPVEEVSPEPTWVYQVIRA